MLFQDQFPGWLEQTAHVVTAVTGLGILGFLGFLLKAGYLAGKKEARQDQRDDQSDRIEAKIEELGSNHIKHLDEKIDTKFDKTLEVIQRGNDRVVDAIMSLKS